MRESQDYEQNLGYSLDLLSLKILSIHNWAFCVHTVGSAGGNTQAGAH